MGKYADIKARRFIRFLKWLGRKKDITLSVGGNHNYGVTCDQTGEKFPIPSSHNVMNKHIVSDFKEWLVERDICTESEFDNNL
jgi:hypothetical protein